MKFKEQQQKGMSKFDAVCCSLCFHNIHMNNTG